MLAGAVVLSLLFGPVLHGPAQGQDAIRSLQINGEQQFFPNASPTG